MGNSLRNSLGHMCGTEAAKEHFEDGDRKPVDRPKGKKSKKNKIFRKVRNGKLGSIKEENELQNHTQPNGKSELPSGNYNGSPPDEANVESNIETQLNESQKHINNPNPIELKETQDTAASSGLPVITVDYPPDAESRTEDEKTPDEVSTQNLKSDGDNISLISVCDEAPNIMVCSFKPIKTESIGIEDADKLFHRASGHYGLYVNGGSRFKGAILEFQKSVDPDGKSSASFLTLWHLYIAQNEEALEKNKDDKKDDSCLLKAMESTGLDFLDIIENIKPVIEECTEKAEAIDAIECAKDLMLEGEGELMTTDKFSAPGKYRRNMARLKKYMKHMAEIELETNEILRCLQVYFNNHDNSESFLEINRKSLARESIIIPEAKKSSQDLDDIFSNLSHESVPIAVIECEDESMSDEPDDRPLTPLPTGVSPDQLSYDAYESPDEGDGEEVFVDVHYESDENCLDSIQVSTEISNCMGLDFDIVTPNSQTNGILETNYNHDTKQTDLDEESCEDDSTIENNNTTCEEVIIANHNSSVDLECTPEDILAPVNQIIEELNEFDQQFEENDYEMGNRSNFVELSIISEEPSNFNESEEIIIETTEVTYEHLELEDSHDESSGESSDESTAELDNISKSTSSSTEGVCNLSDEGHVDIDRENRCISRLDAVEARVNFDVDINTEEDTSTPLTTVFPSTPFCLSKDLEEPSDNVSIDQPIIIPSDPCLSENIFSDKYDGKSGKGIDTTIISVNDNLCSPRFYNQSDLTFDEIGEGIVIDCDGYSDTTSIQEIQILPRVNSPVSKELSVEKSVTLNESEVKDPNSEVDVALEVLKVAINDDDVEDEYVDMLCSSISRVLGDDDEEKPQTPPFERVKSVESSHSSHEENFIHKSFTLSKEVIDWVGSHFQNSTSEKQPVHDEMSDEDEKVTEKSITVENSSTHSPHIISHTIIRPEKYPVKSGDLVRTVNVSVEDMTADDGIDNKGVDDDLEVTFVIKSVPETSPTSDILPPLGFMSSPSRVCHTPPLDVDMEPDHNTLDYGNYVFIDPSTGDIQVMRNRSRSLDSLVSMTSNRSSISRFGSFEFVTDFEINIAEKNQELMKK